MNKLKNIMEQSIFNIESTIRVDWEALPHCPSNQLEQPGDSTDAGYDVRVAEDFLVAPYSKLEYKWEYIGFKEELENSLNVNLNYKDDILITRQGLKAETNYITRYSSKEEKERNIKFLESANIKSEELEEGLLKHTLTTYFRDYSMEVDFHKFIKNNISSYKYETLLYRKVYSTPKIKTGIKIAPESLMWFALTPRSSTPKYGIGMPHSLGIIDFLFQNEILIQVVNLSNEYTIIKRGERIAQLIPMPFTNISFNQVNKIEVSHRGGFGHTGNK